MTRTEILESYDVDAQGVIQSPGKFESEMLYAPHFHEVSLDGCSDCLDWPDGNSTYIVDIDSDDRAEFPEIPQNAVVIAVSESDQGFVSVAALTRVDYDDLLAEHESECEAAESEEEEEEEEKDELED